MRLPRVFKFLAIILLSSVFMWCGRRQGITVSTHPTDVNLAASQIGSYNASGHATDLHGNPIQGVTVEFDQGLHPTTTVYDGEWAVFGLTGTVTATPRKDGWTFSPDSLVITGETAGANFTGRFSVSGRVTDTLGHPVPYATLSFVGNSTSITADADGYWSEDQLSGPTTISVSKRGWTFSPASREVSAPDSGVDFSGTFFVGGHIMRADGTPAGSVRVDFTGGHSSVYSGLDGRWIKTGLCGNVTVTPSLPDRAFAPASINVSGPDNHVDFSEANS